MERHPSVIHLLRTFGYDHLPPGPIRSVHEMFARLAWAVSPTISNPEISAGLRKLRESRDCIVTGLEMEMGILPGNAVCPPGLSDPGGEG